MTTTAYQYSLAHLYDQFKATDNYQKWADLLLEPIRRFGNRGSRLLDVGCGTGTSSLVFAERGFQVTDCDLSPAMLATARARDTAGTIDLLQADMRALPAHLVDFDIVNWMDDVANHLLTEDDLHAALLASAHALAPGGLLIFDVNTLATFRAGFTTTNVIERHDCVFTWVGETDPMDTQERRPWTARIIAFHRNGDSTWQRTDSTVTERYYPPALVEQLITAAGLQCLARYGLHRGQLVTHADDNSHGKIVYIARRPITSRSRLAP